jgi:ribosomal-protein-alanine N-acetyltransferase
MYSHQFSPLFVREATPSDLNSLLELEQACFSSAWVEAAFQQELDLPQAELWLVFEEGEPTPCAYIDFWVVSGEVSLLNVAVHPSVRRRGLAAKLLGLMEVRAAGRGGTTVFLEVRRSNVAAFALYAAEGYEQIGIRKGYYSDNKEDAVVMSKVLDAGSSER